MRAHLLMQVSSALPVQSAFNNLESDQGSLVETKLTKRAGLERCDTWRVRCVVGLDVCLYEHVKGML